MVWQLVLKTVLSGILLMIAWSCCTGAYNLWFSKTVLLTEFQFINDGVLNESKGAGFAKQLNHDIRFLVELYRQQELPLEDDPKLASTDISSTNTAVVGTARPEISGVADTKSRLFGETSAFQVHLNTRVKLEGKSPTELFDLLTGMSVTLIPKQRDSIIDDLQIETKGLNVTEIIKVIERTVIRPNEIGGSVFVTDKKVTVRAQLIPVFPYTPIPGIEWTVDDESTSEDASFVLACKIFRHLANASNPKKEAFGQFTDQEFVVLSELRRNLRRYNHIERTKPAEAKLLLAVIKADHELLKHHGESSGDLQIIAAIIAVAEKDPGLAVQQLESLLPGITGPNEKARITSTIALLSNGPNALLSRPLRTGTAATLNQSVTIRSSNSFGNICGVVQRRDTGDQQFLLTSAWLTPNDPVFLDGVMIGTAIEKIDTSQVSIGLVQLEGDVPRISTPLLTRGVFSEDIGGVFLVGRDSYVLVAMSSNVNIVGDGFKRGMLRLRALSAPTSRILSGTPVTSEDGKVLVGMIVAWDDGNEVLATPIQAVLDAADASLTSMP